MMKMTVVLLSLLVAASADCGCTQDETCCQDNSGYACCVNAESICVQDTPGTVFPARCCPKWTVGCSVGSVGCCDPAKPWQRLIETRNPLAMKRTSPALNHHTPFTASGDMFAIFTAGLSNHLESLTIAASGHITKKEVTGPAATWYTSLYGESTRTFSFDGKRSLFHFVDGKADGGVTLYSINPATGSSTAKTLKVNGYPVGFAYHLESDKFVFSILKGETFTFHSVNVDTGATVVAGSIVRGSGEASAAYYAGYISGIALDGTTVQRLGFQTVTTGSNPGLGSFNLTGPLPSTAKWANVANAANSQFYYTFTRIQNSNDFISLAPAAKGDHSFQMVRWSLNGTSTVLAALPNAHAPASNKIGTLGYVAAGQAGTTYGALVIEVGPDEHKWAIATYDMSAGKYQVNAFQPEFLTSQGAAVSGFGVAA
eukprot:TRINITY_DN4474_c0_g2_i1.p1 TRINITY_DN4474_c0_g2~~TRINITY_DN4474_c0_g2_i1.p1  ORF type:complete len:428 (+),score=102.65 TRINITY_DN4474_c0_g2_i1:50-1333(+)